MKSKKVLLWTTKGIWLWIIILSLLYSVLSLVRHAHFQSGAFDLGLYDQAVWQYSRFLWPFNTIKDRFILGDHLNLSLPLLGSLFWLWNDVRILLIAQACWISFSTLAIYKLSLLRRLSPPASAVIAVVYSLFYGIQFGVFFDFHPVIFGVGLLAWFAYFFESGQKRWWIATLIVLLLTQENMGIAVAGLGCIYIFRSGFRKSGIFMIAGGIFVSLLAAQIITHLSPVGFQYAPHISHSIVAILSDFVNSPEKRQVWLYSLSWYSFLPLLSPGAMLAVAMDLAQYFVTGTAFARMWSPYMHHRAILAVFLTLGLLEAFEKFARWNWPVRKISIMVLLVSVGLQYYFHFPLNKLIKKDFWHEESWMVDNRKLISQIPAGATLASQQSLVPHVSHRKEIYLVFPRIHDLNLVNCQTDCWWLDFGGKPQYLLLDLHPNEWLTQLLETNDHVEQALHNMELARKIKLVDKVNNARLYQINYN